MSRRQRSVLLSRQPLKQVNIRVNTSILSHFSFDKATTCTTPTSTALSYNTTTSVYTLTAYNYTASSTGFAVLEFGFRGQNNYWYLDDVSLVDTNALNSEMLVNGTIEGWQLLCTSNCLSAAGVITYNTLCYAGLFCYTDGCKSGFDFLRQEFSTTIGHIYTLSFWIRTDTKPQQYAFVRFF